MRTHSGSGNAATQSIVPLRSRVWRGLLWGWSVAAIFIVLVTVLSALGPLNERWLAALIIVTYWIVGSIAGVALGFLTPYVRGRARRVVMGFLLALIMMGGAVVAVEGRVPTLSEVFLVVVISAIGGPFFAMLHALLSRFSPELSGWPLADDWP